MTDFCSRPMLERVFRQVALMDRMMERVGAERIAAARGGGGTAWYEARTRCIDCCKERDCEEWLVKTTAPCPSDPPEFCHNADFFKRCRPQAGG